MYYFVVNPVSGCGKGKKIWNTIKKELDQLSVEYEAFLLRQKGEARTVAASLAALSKPFTLVVVGGDGTLNEVIGGLSSFTNVTLGCIPTGSGNDFVRGLKLEKDPLTALHQILHPKKLRRIKIGLTTSPSGSQSAFCVSSGIGFDAAVCNGAYRSGMKDILNWFRLGKLVYTGTALKQLFSSRLCPMKLTLDDGREFVYPRAFFAAAMNLPYEGGGFQFAPDADPCSDRFTLCIAEGLSKPRILSILPLAFFGKHVGKPGIHLIPCSRVTIRTGQPLCVHTDGEIFGFHKEVTFTAHPERLNVIIA